ncbi:hypothetical protein Tsubulata_006286 [Turnera subulata]|uniref:DNA polymerase delta subunit 3 n=1 Tax=Turnera subulata TaxID=218843 RepID=A0A9Q0FV71_9ROSI|nr:hypothetical protein Tsubulata_006286 [Turnera subulata]
MQMAPKETLGILQQIEALVSDKLQVVSYKWLSREFLVPSNAAKQLLHEFVETHGSAIEVIYTLSGWLKRNPSSYHVKLVSAPKLEEAKKEFDGNCSVQVYSVQACIPKDPGELWNAEFVQAEELFKQPAKDDNCLRNSRFCGILNSFVKRTVDGTDISAAASHPKGVEVSEPPKSNSTRQSITVPPPMPVKLPQRGLSVSPKSTNVINDVKTESTEEPASEPPAEKLKVTHDSTANKTKGQIVKDFVNGGSLANLWGRASAKSKPSTKAAEDNKLSSNSTEKGSSGDEAQDIKFKGASNGKGSKKRRVVFDYSDDECEDPVNLASPDLPKELSNQSFVSEKEDRAKLKGKESTEGSSNQLWGKDSSAVSNIADPKTSSEKIHGQMTGDARKDIITVPTAGSPKRRKVLNTRIDERGREVTEVVWEGEDAATNKDDRSTVKSGNNEEASTIKHSAPATKKSPAVGNTTLANPGGKAGNKKGGHKDPKQGNILSFFKKV